MNKSLLLFLLCSCGSAWVPCEKEETPPAPVYTPSYPELSPKAVPDMSMVLDMSEPQKDMSVCQEKPDMSKPECAPDMRSNQCTPDEEWCDSEENDNDTCECSKTGHGKGTGHCKEHPKWHNIWGHGFGHCKYDCL